MLPTLSNGDLVLVDRGRCEARSGRVYAFVDTDGMARVKRLEFIASDRVLLRSDNPAFETEMREGMSVNQISQGIIGEVIWSGHTWAR